MKYPRFWSMISQPCFHWYRIYNSAVHFGHCGLASLCLCLFVFDTVGLKFDTCCTNRIRLHEYHP